jgi:hypothetical protein
MSTGNEGGGVGEPSIDGGLDELEPSSEEVEHASAGHGKGTTVRRYTSTVARRKLESVFNVKPYPSAELCKTIASETPGMTPKQVQNWFQNRRQRAKKATPPGSVFVPGGVPGGDLVAQPYAFPHSRPSQAYAQPPMYYQQPQQPYEMPPMQQYMAPAQPGWMTHAGGGLRGPSMMPTHMTGMTPAVYSPSEGGPLQPQQYMMSGPAMMPQQYMQMGYAPYRPSPYPLRVSEQPQPSLAGPLSPPNASAPMPASSSAPQSGFAEYRAR